ncbi:hypothetical protein EV207_11289 [Scopulibacillus darangshiensis]|uniref:LSM domain-containing protein n=1 Tax=Scopulibacillus darangshiensis TaxID=442528 RepID=A0A4R2P507_9BACL|nr:hypothetical protein [Scopulibacillus darangshiensis]TCP29164.1 hypothetical protein EV207_11289 [Scopulibacillus darangshiensis]
MSGQNFYELCQKYMNQSVEIRCQDGTVHRGTITKVDGSHVYLQPIDGGDGVDGPGVYYFGYGFGFPIALAAIASIALWPFFFW